MRGERITTGSRIVQKHDPAAVQARRGAHEVLQRVASLKRFVAA